MAQNSNSKSRELPATPARLSFPDEEEEILKYWKDVDAFKVSMKLNQNCKPFTFYDGPPFATGLPHYGHILAGTIKDTITRYAHQTGHHVERRFGWDCHGLPVEYEIDKKLGISGKEDVEKMGIRAYNQACRSIVSRYCKEWETTVGRLGRWIDFKNDYKTMEPWYMESVWWVFKTLWEKDLVYQGYKVMPYSTVCNTPLSNFEAGLNYKDVSDPEVIVTFPLIDEPDVSLVAWTTTPWTLPSNLALCVNPEMDYVKIRDVAKGNVYILAEVRLPELYPKMKKQKKKYKGGEFEVLEKFKGATLKGKKYEPIFPYFASRADSSFRVCCDAYVTDDSGTGVVHQAPAFGEDDFRVCLEHGVIQKGEVIPCPLDANGRFTDEVKDFEGMHVKEADPKIMDKLTQMKRIVKKGTIKHSYPFCWRSDTPLIYRVIPSWFIKVESIKEKIVKNNAEGTYWVPRPIKEGRFHNWLVNARDWAVSRNRYWGTPLPIWVSEDGTQKVCIGSVEELKKLSGKDDITDLHRENVDDIEIKDPRGDGYPPLKRVSEVFDCWFESGSMPYAQQHYPFENQSKFEAGFPADFIAEGLDQTRGWFYTLMVISTALFDKPAFKNLIVNGMVLASDGKKMSKRLKNYPDPLDVVHRHGADALRLYLINSPVVRAAELKFKEDGVEKVTKSVFIPWYNAYRFLIQCIDRLQGETGKDFIPTSDRAATSTNSMDRWIEASLQSLVKYVRQEMEAYHLYTVVPSLVDFIDKLTNWYVRLNRPRLKGAEGLQEAEIAVCTLYDVLFTLSKLMAPFTPFFAEYVYQNLRKIGPAPADPAVAVRDDARASVHYLEIPAYDASLLDENIEFQVQVLLDVISQGRTARERRKIGLKMPLRRVIIPCVDKRRLEAVRSLIPYVKAELTVLEIELVEDESVWCTYKAVADRRALGARLKKDMRKVQKAIEKLTSEELVEFDKNGSITLEGHELTKSDLRVQRVFKGDASQFEPQLNKEENFMVIIDTKSDDELRAIYYAREFMSAVQQMRKSAKLEMGDAIEVFFEVDASASGAAKLSAAIEANKDMIAEGIRTVPVPASLRQPHCVKICSKVLTLDVDDQPKSGSVNIILVRQCVAFADDDVLRSACGGEGNLVALKNFVASMAYEDIAAGKANTQLSLNLDGAAVELERGVHFFTSFNEISSGN